jgi:hypothetical protein
MNRTALYRLSAIALAIVLAGVSASPAAGTAQNVTGQARVVQATTLATAVLADTGTLAGTNDARDATLITGNIPSVLSGEVLRAVTVGWPDQVVSEASLANLKMAVGGTGISADFVMARALAVLDAGATASTLIGNLSVNGVPVAVTGSPNQRIAIPGGALVLNEQRTSAAGTTVNAIHATVFGVADVVVATATAGIQ